MTLVKRFNDSENKPYDVYFSDRLHNCPALSILLRTYSEILDKGWATENLPFNNKNRVVWAQREDKIIGGMCYEYFQDNNFAHILLSFVDPEDRGKRIVNGIHEIVQRDCKKLGATTIGSWVHVDNISVQKSVERRGYKPQFIRMIKPIT